jgi:hypothetical protein
MVMPALGHGLVYASGEKSHMQSKTNTCRQSSYTSLPDWQASCQTKKLHPQWIHHCIHTQ